MRKFILILAIILCCTHSVSADSFTAPPVPSIGEQYFPEEPDTFSEGLAEILRNALADLQPDLVQVMRLCFGVIIIGIICSVLNSVTVSHSKATELVAVVSISVLLIGPANSLIDLSVKIVQELSDYGKLLLGVMTSVLSAQGGVTMASAIYVGTMFFISVLTSCISKILIPMVYIYICISIAKCAVGEQILEQIHKFLHWLMTWTLKIALYIFTGYLSITGVVSGSADASAIKATKLTINGVVPVVGNIISDASETILVSAGVMKNAIGIYGLLAIAAVWLAPFIKIGAYYLLLRSTGALCCVFSNGQHTKLITDFSNVMRFLLAITGTVSVLLLVSTVCIMKGVS